MTLFNSILLKEIIEKYFNKQPISNYMLYNIEYYFLLSELLNSILDSEYYINNCNQFLNLTSDINFDNLLEDYPILLEYQPVILLFYKILEQTNLLYPVNINLSTVLENNNNFYFLRNIIIKLKEKEINITFKTMRI